jgi:sugar lactone lactonase YvrE
MYVWWWGLLLCVCACDPPRKPDPDAPPPPDAPILCRKGALDLAVTTVAGCEQMGTDDGDRNAARFSNPVNVELEPDGSIIVADFDNDLLRRVEADGTTTTIVNQEAFVRPFGLALAADGTLIVQTDGNDTGGLDINTGTIWRVDLLTGAATVLTRNVGRPRGVVALPDGRIAMADHLHHHLSILDPSTGIVSPLAGAIDVPGYLDATGTDARFAQPYDMVLLADGDLVVAELDNHVLRRVTLAGVVSTFAGSGVPGNIDGPNAVARFDGPQALALAPDGTLYVTDIHRFFIRRIRNGSVSTIAGDGTPGSIDSNEPRGARFYGLEGIITDGARIVVADGNRGDGMNFHRIRVIDAAALP